MSTNECDICPVLDAAQTQLSHGYAASVVMSPSDKCFCFFGKGTEISAIHVCGYNYLALAILLSSLKLSIQRCQSVCQSG